MSQLSYNTEQAIAVEGSLGDLTTHTVKSYINNNAVKKRYTITVGTAADEVLTLTLTSPEGVVTTVEYNEGAVGTLTTKRNGLISAVNASAARLYCVASAKDADEFYIEATLNTYNFTVAEAETNLTITNDVAFIANANIGFGLAIAQGTQDVEGRLLAATSDKVIGVAVYTHADMINNGVAGYAAQAAMGVLTQGCIWVKPEVAVVAQDAVYVRAVATGTERAGAFRPSADGSDTIQLSNSKFLTSASAGQLALVQINL
jgi:hypothetical protein